MRIFIGILSLIGIAVMVYLLWDSSAKVIFTTIMIVGGLAIIVTILWNSSKSSKKKKKKKKKKKGEDIDRVGAVVEWIIGKIEYIITFGLKWGIGLGLLIAMVFFAMRIDGGFDYIMAGTLENIKNKDNCHTYEEPTDKLILRSNKKPFYYNSFGKEVNIHVNGKKIFHDDGDNDLVLKYKDIDYIVVKPTSGKLKKFRWCIPPP